MSVTSTDSFLTLPLKKLVGRAATKLSGKLGLETVGDLLYYFPRKYHLKGQLTAFADLIPGEEQSVVALIADAKSRRVAGGKWMLTLTLSDGSLQMDAVFWARSQHIVNWMRRQLPVGKTMLFSGRPGEYRGRRQLTHPSYQELETTPDSPSFSPNLAQQAKELVDSPEPIYSASVGLPTWTIAKAVQTVLSVLPPDLADPIPASLRQQHNWPSLPQALTMMHSPHDEEETRVATARFKFEEAFILQTALAQARLKRAKIGAPVLFGERLSTTIHDQVCSELPFSLTTAQTEVLAKIDQHLSQSTPANILLQGDVGAGKTVVALLALLRAVDAGYQGIMMAPTEVLADQHVETITQLLGSFSHSGLFSAPQGKTVNCPVWSLTASTSTTSKRQILAQLAAGEPGIVVGTHALLSDPVSFPRAGLIIIDEQHRFGVEQRDRLRTAGQTPTGEQPHLMVMTATPIPRTVAMASFGDLDLLVLPGLPAGRQPVSTFRVSSDRPAWCARTWTRAAEEIAQGGRVFVVCPAISGSDTTAAVDNLVEELRARPDLKAIEIAALHGRLKAGEKEQIMEDFRTGKTPLLVATTVIEVGVNVPEATMMVIMEADRFGLAQLHQLRGRIGRGQLPGICILWSEAPAGSLADKRLAAFAQTTDGFKLAQMDLQLRQAGNLLGADQSGFRSGLRLLDLVKDEQIIQAARKAAQSVVEKDPYLEQLPGLHEAISQRLSKVETDYLQKT